MNNQTNNQIDYIFNGELKSREGGTTMKRFAISFKTYHTEKRYWQNGHQVRGKNAHSWAFTFGNSAVLICITPFRWFSFSTYKLI